MKKYFAAVLLMSLCPLGYTADAMIIGEGKVLSFPDYVEITIQIDSKCYPLAQDARKINDEATRKITDFLNSKIEKKDNYNSVSTSGGYTAPYTTYYQDKLLCENTFQKQNTIIFRTQDKNFETLFESIQNTVYKQFPQNPPAVVSSSISYVTMSAPLPSISNELQAQLEQKALTAAYHDALAKLAALFNSSKILNLKITQASEIAPNDKPIYPQVMAPRALMMKASGAGNARESVPIQFSAQEIDKTIYFKFTFDDIPLTLK